MLTQARAEARRAGTALRLPAGCCCCLSCRQHFTAFLPCPTERMLPTRHWCRMGGGGEKLCEIWIIFARRYDLWASKPLLVDSFTDDFLLTNLTKLSHLNSPGTHCWPEQGTNHYFFSTRHRVSLFYWHDACHHSVFSTFYRRWVSRVIIFSNT